MILDKHSKEALRLIDEGKNLFITGKAGTGKTTLLGEVVNRLNKKRQGLPIRDNFDPERMNAYPKAKVTDDEKKYLPKEWN